MAAFVARNVGLDRSALGAGGGRAATCGDAAFGESVFALGADAPATGGTCDEELELGLALALGPDAAGTTTGGVSPSRGPRGADDAECDAERSWASVGREGDSADIMAYRWRGRER